MERQGFLDLVSNVAIGKRLPGAIYLHKTALQTVIESLRTSVLAAAEKAGVRPAQWNVVKLSTRDDRISLLLYRDFYNAPFPELSKSYALDLISGRCRVTDYGKSENPPILHRKELLLDPSHRRYAEYQALSKEAERAGLFSDPKRIGFRKQWHQQLRRRGYSLVDGELVKSSQRSPDPAVLNGTAVERHLTAIDRTKLSAPMQSLAQHGYLDGRFSILDYGCGKGDDLRELEAHGLDAIGWDPVYSPETVRRSCDVVNLGFVLNVIENPAERADALRSAYAYTQKLLVVSVMLGGDAVNERFTPFGDGVLTSRNTFQKYFSQQEFKSYIEQVLGESPVAVRPGSFIVFRDKQEEQRFLLERQHVRREWRQLTARPPMARAYLIPKEKIDQHIQLFEDFWQTSLDLGRIPANDEFDFSEQIRAVAGSHKRAFESLKQHFDTADFEEASQKRAEDLIVFFALAAFDRKNSFARLSPRLKRDVGAFLGNYGTARERARTLLYSIADLDRIRAACVEGVREVRCGRALRGHSLTIHRRYLDRFPAILRVYVGCAGALYGDLSSVDLIKIHYTSPKVTLLRYQDFDSARLPVLRERIKINLATQRIEFFSNERNAERQLLYFKSDFDSPTERDAEQTRFDDALRQVVTLDENGLGPTLEELEVLIS